MNCMKSPAVGLYHKLSQAVGLYHKFTGQLQVFITKLLSKYRTLSQIYSPTTGLYRNFSLNSSCRTVSHNCNSNYKTQIRLRDFILKIVAFINKLQSNCWTCQKVSFTSCRIKRLAQGRRLSAIKPTTRDSDGTPQRISFPPA